MAQQQSAAHPASLPAQSSNNSDDDTRSGTLAPKNRACPFCNQLFTSSSLGRHLDLYIKPKNPKAPDGVHDVAQIRKIRSQITRRHARSSTGKRNDSERAQSTASMSDAPDSASKPDASSHLVQAPPQAPSLPYPRFTQTGTVQPPAAAQQAGAMDFHRLKWQATGVINDLPPRSVDSPRLDIFRDPEHRQRYLEERDNGRAAEMALREVLGEIQAAQIRLRNTPLFEDFDFFACNFPSLCFKLLAPPPTLYSTTPIPTPDAWPIGGPPDQNTYNALKELLRARISDYHRLHQTPVSSPPLTHTPASRDETQRYEDHLDLVWSQWSALSPQDAATNERWNLELFRAAADERRLRQDTARALAESQSEIDHLRAELAEQAASIAADPSRPATERALWLKVQRPTAAALHAPAAPAHVPSSLAQRLDSTSKWDYHSLVTKWRETLRSGVSSAYPPPSHHSPSGSGVHSYEQHSTQQTNGLGTAQTQESAPDNHQHDQSIDAQSGHLVGMNPSKRSFADTGVLDYSQHYHQGRPAPALRDQFTSNGGQTNGRRPSPAMRDR